MLPHVIGSFWTHDVPAVSTHVLRRRKFGELPVGESAQLFCSSFEELMLVFVVVWFAAVFGETTVGTSMTCFFLVLVVIASLSRTLLYGLGLFP